MQRSRIWALMTAVLLLTGCAAPGQGDDGESGETSEAQELSDLVPPGKPQRCIDTRRIRSVRPLDANTLLFHMRNGDVWRSRLPVSCPGLHPDVTLMYEARSSKLCNLDSVTVLTDTGFGFLPGLECGLGKFDYLTEDQANTLREAAKSRR